MTNYIGNQPSAGEFKRLDSIASLFNGSATQFNLTYNSVSSPVGDSSQLIVSLNGIIQEPLNSYTLGVGGSSIVFASAPASGDECYIVSLGGVGGTASTVTDNSITSVKINDGAVTSSKISIDGDITFPDNDKAIFGDGSDLQIYHHGGASVIKDAGVGDLYLAGSGSVKITNDAINENMAVFNHNGSVDLYYDSSKKLATTSTGVDVTGNILRMDGTSPMMYFMETGVTDSNHRIRQNTGNLYFQKLSDDTNTATTRMAIDGGNGDISFYDSTGTTPKFVWDASTESLGIGTNSPISALDVLNGGSAYTSGLVLRNGSSTSEATSLYHDNTGFTTTVLANRYGSTSSAIKLILQAASGSPVTALTALGGGNVGVGTSVPAHKLEVAGTAKADQYLLDAVAKDISDTAVDVFVYDTRKDSDGGAWRKRTQNTSWYNETLNTATRGARKEFPAVAVIVTESNKVTIYDGDNPDMPMWMVFDGGDRADMIYGLLDNSQQATKMLNGLLVSVGNDSGGQGGTFPISFIADNGYFLSDASNSPYKYKGNIEQRNDGLNISAGESGNYGITTSRFVNDVAMTVLPNAPIDAATGLPVPTIAVATAGGVSVIKDDGTVVDIKATNSYFYYSHQVSFTDDGKIILLYSYSGVADDTHVYYTEIPSADKTFTAHSSAINANLDSNSYVTFLPQYSNQGSSLGGSKILATNQFYGGNAAGLVQYDPENDLTKSLAADITSTYNTGWMNGDIKLATLSDTDDTNVTGTELVTNGTFDTDTSGWTAHNGSVTLSVSSGALVITTTSASYGYAYQAISGLTVGETYTATLNFLSANAATWVRLGTTFDGQGYYGTTPSTGIINVTFTATNSTLYITLVIGAGSSGLTCSFDDISVRLAEEDRSVNGNGLQVFGTVAKTPVAAGADLVAYSGFSSSNYLQQPYNSDLDFGTGDFCFMAWVYGGDSSTDSILVRGGPVGNVPEKLIIFDTVSSTHRFVVFDGQTRSISGTSVSNTWKLLVGLRRNGVLYFYVDGVLQGWINNTSDLSGSNHYLRIGYPTFTADRAFVGSVALVRASATAPSPEQIKKIYEDEKVLFQENAKATLYGSSDAVTALAYDDDTELLHVGTSAGRSVFQGLRRIDNTTDAVGAAISASNGMVAED